MALERLQKILARAGVASRRSAERLIVDGRVTVGGRVVKELGARADAAHDRIELDGKVLSAEAPVYLVFHKPRGVVSTMRDPANRPSVADYLKAVGARVVPVGRLDFHTSGVLLLTNDGDFAMGLSHPKHAVEKVYVAKVDGAVSDDELERFRRSIVIDGRATQPAQVQCLRVVDGKSWIEVRLREGRNRQVRRLGDAAGLPVLRLARVEYAGITAHGLLPGKYRPLTRDELLALKRRYGVPAQVAKAPREARPRFERPSLPGAATDRARRGERRDEPRTPEGPRRRSLRAGPKSGKGR